MSKMKPFRTDHTYATPDEAVEFYERETGETIPEGAREFLEMVAGYDSEAVFNVQPGFLTHYIAVARPQDRRAWAFVKPEKIAMDVGHPSNVVAMLDLFDETLRPETLTKGTLSVVEFEPEDGGCEAAEFALVFAAAHAAPRVELPLAQEGRG